MIIQLDSGLVVSGEAILENTLRSNLEPIPVTFEAKLRLDESIALGLLEGSEIKVGRNLTPVTIVFARDSVSPVYQAGEVKIRHIIALHSNSRGIGYRLERAFVGERISLSAAYKACGGKSAIEKDFIIDRFYCYKGMTPSYQISRICQEYGGVVRWGPENDTLSFARINDLFNQEPVMSLPAFTDSTKKSGFLERHEVPSYISTGAGGGITKGDFSKPRAVEFSPHKTTAQLHAMSQVLLNAKEVPCRYSPEVHAGDIILQGDVKFIVISAAHSFMRMPSGQEESRSIFWLGVK